MSTLCLQLAEIKTILDEINIYKPESKKAPNLTLCFKNPLGEMVGVTGIEPVTPSMSTKCSPAELHPPFHTGYWPILDVTNAVMLGGNTRQIQP